MGVVDKLPFFGDFFGGSGDVGNWDYVKVSQLSAAHSTLMHLCLEQCSAELVGLAVLGTYAYRYVTDPDERASAQESIDSFISSVTGK